MALCMKSLTDVEAPVSMNELKLTQLAAVRWPTETASPKMFTNFMASSEAE